MREGEPEYWDSVADKVVRDDGGIYDNWEKRRVMAQFLLKCQWGGQKVLEIGVGCAATASLLSYSCGNQWDYIGTDVSPKFVAVAQGFGHTVIQADVLDLPDGPFTRILALDSLEHVHPNDRSLGYQAIANRLAKDGLLFINMPHDRSLHDDKFDHGIGLKDIVLFEESGLYLQKFEHYRIKYASYMRGYDFVVMSK